MEVELDDDVDDDGDDGDVEFVDYTLTLIHGPLSASTQHLSVTAWSSSSGRLTGNSLVRGVDAATAKMPQISGFKRQASGVTLVLRTVRATRLFH